MDPTAALQELLDAIKEGDYDEAREHLENLDQWISRGGFLPKFGNDHKDSMPRESWVGVRFAIRTILDGAEAVDPERIRREARREMLDEFQPAVVEAWQATRSANDAAKKLDGMVIRARRDLREEGQDGG